MNQINEDGKAFNGNWYAFIPTAMLVVIAIALGIAWVFG